MFGYCWGDWLSEMSDAFEPWEMVPAVNSVVFSLS